MISFQKLHNHSVIKLEPVARFWKAPETFRARKAIFNQSVSKNREVCTGLNSSLKTTSAHIIHIFLK